MCPPHAIETERLVLRAPSESDLLPIAQKINNPRITRNLARAPWPYKLENARGFLDHVRSLRNGETVFAMVERRLGLLGLIGYEFMGKSVGAELGYWLAEEYWSRGFATEAARAVLDHAFNVSRHAIIHSRCRLDNPGSRRVLEKSGFRFTGIGPCYVACLGTWAVCQTYELTMKEWRLMRGWRPDVPERAP